MSKTMGNKPKPKSDETDGKSFEHHLKQLETMVQQLETGQMDLSESLKVFEAGVQHLRACHQRLREAEERISLVVQVDADGTARLKDFTSTSGNETERGRGGKRSSAKDSDQLF